MIKNGLSGRENVMEKWLRVMSDVCIIKGGDFIILFIGRYLLKSFFVKLFVKFAKGVCFKSFILLYEITFCSCLIDSANF